LTLAYIIILGVFAKFYTTPMSAKKEKNLAKRWAGLVRCGSVDYSIDCMAAIGVSNNELCYIETESLKTFA
jgi:hypothetical protein